ncbi:hypothetical protein Sinac_1418 [Singulisphaera acidiphila DSM 18658]|uniref:Uncharacterized protein n=2 Tax=Singulisphaera acidiphila TaxID=466153 RepID=L0DAV3_SINAD|nr:hypothetical protein Sinac_1418 [Singulisphaera acidiphila DSM 18658]
MSPEPAGQLTRQMDLTPLKKMVMPLSTPVSQEVAAIPHSPPKSAVLAALSSDEIMLLLSSPAKLREAIILNELLQPPLSLRGKRSRLY